MLVGGFKKEKPLLGHCGGSLSALVLNIFVPRGDLWLNWEHGLKFFLNYMIDADWAVCAGNWMWVSSSAFEKSLNTSFSLDPSVYGCRVDPHGTYIR